MIKDRLNFLINTIPQHKEESVNVSLKKEVYDEEHDLHKILYRGVKEIVEIKTKNKIIIDYTIKNYKLLDEVTAKLLCTLVPSSWNARAKIKCILHGKDNIEIKFDFGDKHFLSFLLINYFEQQMLQNKTNTYSNIKSQENSITFSTSFSKFKLFCDILNKGMKNIEESLIYFSHNCISSEENIGKIFIKYDFANNSFYRVYLNEILDENDDINERIDLFITLLKDEKTADKDLESIISIKQLNGNDNLRYYIFLAEKENINLSLGQKVKQWLSMFLQMD